MLQKFSKRRELLSAAMLLCFCAFTNNAMAQTWNTGVGHNGAPLTAELTGSGNNRTLTVKGNGLMADFQVSSGGVPWKDYLTNIATVVINNGVLSVGDYAFSGCTELKTVTFISGSDVSIIGYRSFEKCTSLSLIEIPKSVTTIEGEAFLNCTGLKTVKFEEESGDLNFEAYTVDPKTHEYRYDWFKNCPIQTLELKRQYKFDRYTYAGTTLFKGNNHLQTLIIGRYVTLIEISDFADCSSLTNVTIQDGSDELIFGSWGAESVFNGCPINTLYLGRKIYTGYNRTYTPFSVEYKSPFYNKTSLETLTIGKDLSWISEYAFQGCIRLTTITSNNLIPPTVGSNCFDDVNKTTCKVNVPRGTQCAYQSANQWKEFTNIVDDTNTACTNGINDVVATQLQIFPNPVKDDIFIKTDLQVEKVEICSFAGTLLTQENNFNEKISISALPEGIYLLRIYTDKGVAVSKIVKE